MKKLALTFAIVLGMGMALSAQEQPAGGGLFGKGGTRDGASFRDESLTPMIPQLGKTDDQYAPLGSSLLLIGFGAAYAMLHKDKKERKE